MRTYVLISLLSVIGLASCRPQEIVSSNLRLASLPVQANFRYDTENRANKAPGLRDTMDMVAKQLIDANGTDFTRDTRTPPKIKLQHRNSQKKSPPKPEIEEVSHPGIAVPIDVDKFLETTTVQRVEPKSTTDSGLSTWILLSGNSPSTKPARRPPTVKTTTSKPVVTQTASTKFVQFVEKPKPTPKPKPSTRRPTTTTVASTEPKAPNKVLTKVKASVLNNAMSNKTIKTTTPTTTTTTIKTTTTQTTTKAPTTLAEEVKEVKEQNDVSSLKPEAKIVEVELVESKATTKKPPKRPNNNNNNNNNNKRKKNKNRRRKPENKNNATKVAQKEKPIGTQIYNYLSREVMPTVGVGLVGLVVTAGLASYFLFPFTGLRRNFEGATDRRDEHIYDGYISDGELEQDVIGKMIEGGYEYPNSFANSIYQPYSRYNDYDTSKLYDDRIISERQKESGYTVDDRKFEQKQFVVGNIPDSFVPVTPAAVPEHGPRSLRIRRQAPKEQDNEVVSTYKMKFNKYKIMKQQQHQQQVEEAAKQETTTTMPMVPIKTETNENNSTVILHREPNNFFTFLRNVFEMKVRVGLDFLLNTTDSFSRYLRGVQERVEKVMKTNQNRYNTKH